MKALFFKDKKLSLIEKPVPVPGKGEALIKTLVAGICNTDLELLQGYYGFSGVAGHEFVGRVEKCPDCQKLVGQRVGADINLGCGTCPLCLSGDSRHCPDRQVLGIVGADGAFAQYVKIPVKNLCVVDPSLENNRAVFAEPLAAALEIAQQVPVRATDKVLVLGDGKLGLLAALCLRLVCPGTVLAGKHENNLKIAKDRGVGTFIVSSKTNQKTPRPGQGLFDMVVEATGSQHGLAQAMACVRPEGTIVAKTTSRNLSQVDMAKIVVDEITIIGSRCGNIGFALDHLAQNQVDPSPLVKGVFPFEDFQKAFALAKKPGALKVLLSFQ